MTCHPDIRTPPHSFTTGEFLLAPEGCCPPSSRTISPMGAEHEVGAGAQGSVQDAAILPGSLLLSLGQDFSASRWEWAAALFDCYLFMAASQYPFQPGQEAICEEVGHVSGKPL